MTLREEPDRTAPPLSGVAAYLFRERSNGFEILLLRRKSSRYFGKWFPIEGRIEVGGQPRDRACSANGPKKRR